MIVAKRLDIPELLNTLYVFNCNYYRTANENIFGKSIYCIEPRKSQWMYNGVAVSQEEEQSLNNWKVVALSPGPCCLHFVVSLGKILNP